MTSSIHSREDGGLTWDNGNGNRDGRWISEKLDSSAQEDIEIEWMLGAGDREKSKITSKLAFGLFNRQRFYSLREHKKGFWFAEEDDQSTVSQVE